MADIAIGSDFDSAPGEGARRLRHIARRFEAALRLHRARRRTRVLSSALAEADWHMRDDLGIDRRRSADWIAFMVQRLG